MPSLVSSRLCRLVAGWLLVVAGVLVAPTPLPIGVAMMVVGLCLLAHDSKTLRGLIRRLRRRHSVASARVDAIKHRLPALLRRVVERTDPRRCPRFRARRTRSSP